MNVIFSIDKVHTAPQRALESGLGGLNQLYGTNRPTQHPQQTKSCMIFSFFGK